MNLTDVLSALIGAAVALTVAWLARRSSKESNTTTSWAALTGALQADLTRLRGDVGMLRDDLDQVKRDLEHERRERQSLATVLRSAWSHILRLGDQVRTLGGHPEPPPAELTAWMRQDGLIVDRVETTISRTTVTDTRSPDEPELVVDDCHVDGED